jgi:hypothetical protein
MAIHWQASPGLSKREERLTGMLSTPLNLRLMGVLPESANAILIINGSLIPPRSR